MASDSWVERMMAMAMELITMMYAPVRLKLSVSMLVSRSPTAPPALIISSCNVMDPKLRFRKTVSETSSSVSPKALV